MNPWEAVSLTPFEASQAIVAARHGAAWASRLPFWRALPSLANAPGGAEVVEAFNRAAADLHSWCRRGLIPCQGRRQIGLWQLTNDREEVGAHWSNSHCFDFIAGNLNGDPRYERVMLRGDDVRALAIPSRAVEECLPKRKAGRLPDRRWSAVEALVEAEIDARGWPEDQEGLVGWRCRADVERFMADELARQGWQPAKDTLQKHAQVLLDRLRPTKAGK